MSSRKVVADFLKREAWHLVRYIDLGTTAHVFVVEKDGEGHVLKTRRDGGLEPCAVSAEYRVLQYLNRTSMQPTTLSRAHTGGAWVTGGVLWQRLPREPRVAAELFRWASTLNGSLDGRTKWV
jgi:hypothetical protein